MHHNAQWHALCGMHRVTGSVTDSVTLIKPPHATRVCNSNTCIGIGMGISMGMIISIGICMCL